MFWKWAGLSCQTGSSQVFMISAFGFVIMLIGAEILSCLELAHFTGEGLRKFILCSIVGETGPVIGNWGISPTGDVGGDCTGD